MSYQIVPVDPADVFLDMDPILPEDSPTSQFTRSLTFQEQYVCDEPFDSEKLPATLASVVQRLLHIANLVESEEPRVAYLCRLYTFEEAHRMDSSGTGRGVRQFKKSLLLKLSEDEEITIRRRKETSDVKELKRVYHAYKKYIIKHGASFKLDKSQLEKLINARSIASALYEILKIINPSIELNRDKETGRDIVTLTEETHKRNSDETFVDKKTELMIVEKCKALEEEEEEEDEEERLTQMSQLGDDSVQSNHLAEDKVQIKKESVSNDGGPSFAVPSSINEDKYLETQDKLNKIEKKIEEMDMKFKDVEFWSSMMQHMFPDQVPPSMRANLTSL